MSDVFRQHLVRCITTMLTPVVRLCVRHSLQLNELIELLKAIYVDAADNLLGEEMKAVSASRISAVTGVHRKDISRLRGSQPALRAESTLIGRVMAQWQFDKRFSSKPGKARTLGCAGRDSEFSKLVASVNGGDLSGYAVLFEMERVGAVERKGDQARLCWRDYVSNKAEEEGLTLLAGDMHDLGLAVEENLFSTLVPKNQHLKTQFDNIALESLPVIKGWLLEQGSLFHRKVRAHLARYDLDLNPALGGKEGGARVVFGSFSLAMEKEIQRKAGKL